MGKMDFASRKRAQHSNCRSNTVEMQVEKTHPLSLRVSPSQTAALAYAESRQYNARNMGHQPHVVRLYLAQFAPQVSRLAH